MSESELFDEVRKRCPPEAWTLGVSLARGGAVSLRSADEDEIVARVTVAGSALTPTVSLFPGDGEWECDCASSLDACEHVAAAVIARRQGLLKTAETTEARPIVYRLRSTSAGLHFERGVEAEGVFHAIEFPLEATASGTFDGPRFEATPRDIEVEKALRGNLRGVLDRAALPRVFASLASVRDITLDGEPVLVSGEKVTPPVVIEDLGEGRGFRLALSSTRSADGFVVDAGRLRPVGEPELTGREREELTRGRLFGRDAVGVLVGEVLPSLRARVPIEVRTNRLPEAKKSKPELVVTLHRNGDALYVLPKLGYPETYPLRDVAAERAIEEDLKRRFGLTLDRGIELGSDEAVAFVSSLEGIRIEGDGFDAFRDYGVLAPRVQLDPAGFEASFEASGRPAEPRAVLRAWREGQSLVPLLDGGFAKLPLDWLDRCGDTLADLLAARREDGSLGPASRGELARLAEELEVSPPPPIVVGEPSPIPQELEPHLRDYQKRGVSWLLLLRSGGLGGLLADDMGLGKTLQALGAIEGRSLVIAPTSVLANWVAESRRFRPGLSVTLYHGRERKLDDAADLTVTSHALLRLDADRLSAVEWDTVVLDEAQAIRNPDTDLARAAYRLRARSRISLTGTPIENRLSDLWSQFHFLDRGFLGSREDFEERYVKPVERGAIEPLERLKERIRPFHLRRLKAEVAPELPPRTEITLRATLSDEERAVYDAVRLAARRDVLEKLEQGKNVLAVLEALLRLRQAACHPALVPGQSAETSSKTDLLMETLETAAAEGHKSLVFSQWTSMLDLLEGPIEARGLGYLRLDGSTRDRSAVVERFQNDESVPVFLLSLKAGGTGLNLTAADHVFLFDPWWNPAVEEQAFDRAHRIGQEKPVFVHRLVAEDTVEEKILALQETKRRIASMAAGGSGASVTRDELLALLA